MSRDLHKEITDRIIATLKSGAVPWRQPWSNRGHGIMPRNAISERAYSGINVLLLWSRAQASSYSDHRWLTYKQASEAGGNVRKGEKGETIVFVSKLLKKEETGEVKTIAFLKAYTVFNIVQCENLPQKIIDPARSAQRRVANPDMRDELADAFVESTRVEIRYDEARAYYRPFDDYVNMPRFETFVNASRFYGVMFHELTHASGAEHRLNRTFGKRFGDSAYSVEELVAELGSAFMCAEFGFDSEGADAAYIARWVKFLEDHDRAIVAAAAAASKAVEFYRSLTLTESNESEEMEAAA